MDQQQFLTNPPDYKVDIKGIFAKVKWTDIPIVATIVFYLSLLIIALKVRKNPGKRTIVFAFCLGLTLLIGQFGHLIEENWKIIGFSDNYFDQFGVFLSFFFALPPVFIAILLLSQLVGNIFDKMISRYVAQKRMKQNEEKAEQNKEEEEKNEKEIKNEEGKLAE